MSSAKTSPMSSSKLQAVVPADPPGVAQRHVEAELGATVVEAVRLLRAEPFASGSVAQVHRADPRGRNRGGREGAARRRRHQGPRGPRAHAGVAAYLESEDPELAQLRPTILVDEFATMMDAAIDLREELSNLQRFQQNFADEPDVVIPDAVPRAVEARRC